MGKAFQIVLLYNIYANLQVESTEWWHNGKYFYKIANSDTPKNFFIVAMMIMTIIEISIFMLSKIYNILFYFNNNNDNNNINNNNKNNHSMLTIINICFKQTNVRANENITTKSLNQWGVNKSSNKFGQI